MLLYLQISYSIKFGIKLLRNTALNKRCFFFYPQVIHRIPLKKSLKYAIIKVIITPKSMNETIKKDAQLLYCNKCDCCVVVNDENETCSECKSKLNSLTLDIESFSKATYSVGNNNP